MGKKKTQMIGWKPLRRRLRRLRRRKPALYRALSVGAAALCVLAAGGLIACGTTALLARAPQAAPQVEVAALALPPTDTPVPTPEPTPTPLPTPSPTPGGGLYLQPVGDIAPESDPAINELVSPTAYLDEEDALSKFRFAGVRLGASEDYAALEGVTTFRGSNYRDGGAWGTIPEDPSKLEIVWSRVIGSLDEWSGVGWTGQASVVRWPEETRRRMNIDAAKKEKDGLTEVLYATLDGHIYFMDLEDGENTRDAIDIGAPIKGSLAVDPRGLPLMYCGQGIYEVDDKKLRCGTRIFSLIDQKLLYFLNGQDSHALRYWYAFDCSPLVDGAADTMITVGENGVLYKVRLNTVDSGEGISIEPTVERYVYSQKAKGKLGTENSLAIYNHYAFFATNIGVIQCVDLDDMSLKWCYDGLDDIDASLVIEPETEALVGLYAVNELCSFGLSLNDLCSRGVRLGADVPYCLMQGTALAEGIGEILTPLENAPQCHVLIAKPGISVSTKYVYEQIDSRKDLAHPDIDGMLQAIAKGDLRGMADRLGNVLEEVTKAECPLIGEIERIMLENGALGAAMSGSGPTVFGLFEEKEKALGAYDILRGMHLAKQVYLTAFYHAGSRQEEKDAGL